MVTPRRRTPLIAGEDRQVSCPGTLFEWGANGRWQGLSRYSLRVMEAATEAERDADQQSACDELTCVIHDVKSPVFELGDWVIPAGPPSDS